MNGDESKPLILNSTIHQPVFEGVLLCTVLGVPLVYFGSILIMPELFSDEIQADCYRLFYDLEEKVRGLPDPDRICREPRSHGILVAAYCFLAGIASGAIFTGTYAVKKIKSGLKAQGFELHGD